MILTIILKTAGSKVPLNCMSAYTATISRIPLSSA